VYCDSQIIADECVCFVEFHCTVCVSGHSMVIFFISENKFKCYDSIQVIGVYLVPKVYICLVGVSLVGYGTMWVHT
jgi:hypothetical protein